MNADLSSEADSRKAALVVALLAVLAFSVTWSSPIDYTFSDPWGNLLTAQALLEHGTVQLDSFGDAPALAELNLGWHHRGHLYSYFPVGTAVLSLPAVWLAREAGLDMRVNANNSVLQRVLAAASVAVSVPLLFALARFRLKVVPSLVLTAVFVFGSSTVSTLGVGLWSSNGAYLFHLCALLARQLRRPILTVGCLFIAFLCRPTAAILIVVVGILTAFLDPKLLRRMVPFGASLSIVVIGWSWFEYGLLLPPYYQASRLDSSTFLVALAGNLVSPSRGLLIVCPFLIPVMVGAAIWRRKLWADDLFRIGTAWFILHWMVISAFPVWWGGWSFGNRLFADALPAAALISISVIACGIERVGRGDNTLVGSKGIGFWVIVWILPSLAAVYVHTVKGLTSERAFLWCQDGSYRHHLFDWEHPQFMASERNDADHNRAHLTQLLPVRDFVTPFNAGSRDVIFEGWSRAEQGGTFRWTNGPFARVLVKTRWPDSRSVELRFHAGTYGRQRFEVEINGTVVGEFSSLENWTPSDYVLHFDRSLVDGGEGQASFAIVEIGLRLPDAQRPSSSSTEYSEDTRLLGLCLRELSFSVLSEAQTLALHDL